MPEGSAHSILDGLYDLHETVGTGGFAKVSAGVYIFLIGQIWVIREAAKKSSFLSGPAPRVGLVAIGFFPLKLKKFFFSIVAHPPPLLVARPLWNELFFAASVSWKLKVLMIY